MQFSVKQLGKALSQESTHDAASSNLNKLSIMLFHQSMTSEEAYYVGEMARGADIMVASKVSYPYHFIFGMTDMLGYLFLHSSLLPTGSDVSTSCFRN